MIQQLLIKEQGRYISSGNVTLLVHEENPVGMWAITIYDNFSLLPAYILHKMVAPQHIIFESSAMKFSASSIDMPC